MYMYKSGRSRIAAEKSALARYKKQSRKYKAKAKLSRSTKGPVDLVTNTQIINKGRDQVYVRKSTYSQNVISGTGASVAAVLQWYIVNFPDIGNLSSVFGSYKCLKLVYTFKLVNLEATDNAVIPEVYIRYNHDPDLTTTSPGNLMVQRNVVRHQFTPSDLMVEYTIYPKKMIASQVYNSTTLTATPVKASWEDTDKTVGHYGLQYYCPNLPTGMQIEVLCTAVVAFKEQW